MTDLKAALVEAMRHLEETWDAVPSYSDAHTYDEHASAILAHPAMQAIAEKVELADAVEALESIANQRTEDELAMFTREMKGTEPREVYISQTYDDGWAAGIIDARTENTSLHGTGPTLLAALQEATND